MNRPKKKWLGSWHTGHPVACRDDMVHGRVGKGPELRILLRSLEN